jgi:hypothetical protein
MKIYAVAALTEPARNERRLMVVWTTAESKEEAERKARGSIIEHFGDKVLRLEATPAPEWVKEAVNREDYE